MINFTTDYIIAQIQKKNNTCDYCGRQKELFPSYILIKTCCPNCSAKFSKRSFIIPAVSLILGILLLIYKIEWYKWGIFWLLWFYCCLVIIVDYESRKIPKTLLVGGFLFAAVIGTITHGIIFAIIGAVLNGLVFLLLFIGGMIYKNLLYKDLPKNNLPLGINDVFLACIFGLILGKALVFQGLGISFIFTSVLCCSYLIFMLICKSYNPLAPIPIGSILSLSTFIVYLCTILGYQQICLLSFCMTFPEPSFPFAVFP